MVGWHHRLSGHKFEQTPGASGGQESLACCSSKGHKEWDTGEKLNSSKNFQTDPAPRLGRPVGISRAPQASGADGEMLRNNLEGLLRHSLMCPTPEFLIQQVWRGIQKSAFPASSQFRYWSRDPAQRTTTHGGTQDRMSWKFLPSGKRYLVHVNIYGLHQWLNQ